MPQLLQIVQTFSTLAVPVVCFAIVYFLGRIKPIGRFYATLLILPGLLFSALATFLTPFDPKQKTKGNKYPGLRTIVLCIALLFCVVACVADGYNTIQALSALWADTSFSLPPLPGILTYSMGWLFLSLPALTGAIWLEQKRAVEPEAHIFTVPDEYKKKFERFIFLTFLLSLTTSIAFNALKPSFTADSGSVITQSLQIAVFVLMGVLLPLVMTISLYITALALQAVASLVLTIVWFLTTSIANFLEYLVLDFSRREMSLKDKVIGEKVEDRTSIVKIGQENQAALPERASTIVDSDLEKIEPIETTEMEIPLMTNPDKNAALVLVGNLGTKMNSPLAQKFDSLRALETILTGLYLDMSVPYKPLGIPGITDLSPTQVDRFASMLHGEETDQIYTTLLTNTSDAIVQAHLPKKINPSPLIAIIDCHQLASSVAMLQANKRRINLLRQLVVTSVSSHDAQEPIVEAGLAEMHKLHAEGVIEMVLVVDSKQSPFATLYGEETLLLCLAQFLVSLVIAHKHSVRNDALPKLLEDLHSVSPFYTVSFASEVVAVGKMPKRWSWIPGVKGQTGTGVYGDILSQSRTITDQVLTEEDTRAFPAEVLTGTPVKILYNVPIALNDPRFAHCVRDNALFVGTQYPNATSLTIRGNGCAYPYHLGGRFLVGITALYPLQAATFPRVLKNIKITSLYPEKDIIETVNDLSTKKKTVPVNRIPRKKAVTTSRATKQITAPSRRGTRLKSTTN